MSAKASTKSDKKLPATKPGEKQKPTKPLHEVGTVPPRTVTLPEHMRGPWTQGLETITALAVEGEDRIYELPRTKAVVTIGSQSDQDVTIASPHVSREHCVIQRRGLRTYVIDADSKNGIVVGDALLKEFEIKPGDRFKLAGRLTIAALNDAMSAQLPIVGQLVCREVERREKGSQERPSPLDVLAVALDTVPVLITGEAGCDHERLARALHAMSPRKLQDLFEVTTIPDDRKDQRAIIDQASRSTLILSIADGMQPLETAFVETLFDRSYNVRVIALAPSAERATEVLGAKAVRRMTEIYLRSIAYRPTVIPWLLDEMLRERGSALHTSELTTANRDALENYDWKENLAEMRQVADWLITVEKCGSLRAAAEQLNVPRMTFSRWLAKIGLGVPLTRSARTLE